VTPDKRIKGKKKKGSEEHGPCTIPKHVPRFINMDHAS